jgi:hemolysin III
VSKATKLATPHLETPAEEVASMLTHAVGGLLAAVGLTLLVLFAGRSHDARRMVSVSIYGASLVLLYCASTCYHYVRSPRLKRRLKILDHASIYLLIAGNYTPILLVSMRGAWGWSLFGVVWGLAITGAVLKLFFVDRFTALSTSMYVAMGWLAVIGFKPLIAAVPVTGMIWLVAGGLSYTFGVGFYVWDRLPFNHAIWHLFVIAGSVCHFIAVFFYVLPVGTR